MISCWNLGLNENKRMWNNYGKDKNAVAIETTLGALKEALGPSFLFVPVSYIDDLEESIPKLHSLEPFFFKRKSYEWEREIRIIGEMEIREKARVTASRKT